MENDNPLAPRKSAIPVTARRSDLPAVSDAPVPAGPQPYVIFVQTPAPAVPATAAPQMPPAQYQPAPPPPQQFHTTHNTTTTVHHHHLLRRDRGAGHSTLGMASLALGIIACVVCWIPVLGLAAVPIGAIGAVLGILGILISLLFRRSSAALPAAGVFICLLAAGISIASTGSLVYWRHQLQRYLPPSITAPHNPPARKLDPTVAPPARVDPAVRSAAEDLKAAEQAAIERFTQSEQYRQSQQEQAQAEATVTALRVQSPGSAALKDAAQHLLDTRNSANELRDRTVRADPAVIAARDNLAHLRESTTTP